MYPGKIPGKLCSVVLRLGFIAFVIPAVSWAGIQINGCPHDTRWISANQISEMTSSGSSPAKINVADSGSDAMSSFYRS